MCIELNNPVEAVAAALYAACLRDLPEIRYRDRDWEKHRKMLDAMTREEKAAFYEREKQSGQAEGCFIEKVRRPAPCDVHVAAMFPQVWGSTALGFGGIGGQAMTTAYTVVVESPRAGTFAVYFGSSGRIAYLVPSHPDGGDHNEKLADFHADLAKTRLSDCAGAARRYGAIGCGG